MGEIRPIVTNDLRIQVRCTALQAAVTLHGAVPFPAKATESVEQLAEEFERWLTRPTASW